MWSIDLLFPQYRAVETGPPFRGPPFSVGRCGAPDHANIISLTQLTSALRVEYQPGLVLHQKRLCMAIDDAFWEALPYTVQCLCFSYCHLVA